MHGINPNILWNLYFETWLTTSFKQKSSLLSYSASEQKQWAAVLEKIIFNMVVFLKL